MSEKLNKNELESQQEYEHEFENSNRYPEPWHQTGLEIAIIGMTCRFPGANDVDTFWQNLISGTESITFFEESHENPAYVPARGVIDDAEMFDAPFFGYKPYEAEIMDPQTRVFYQCCWEALELAGYNPESYEGLIGLYAGANNNRPWEIKALLSERAQSIGAFAMDHYIDRDFLATRLAYRLNLRGPAVTVKTACSTALVAVDMAARALLTGQCEMALAGAVTVWSADSKGYTYREGMVMSPDGHCRAFDESSNGVIFSDGAGVVVLKRLSDALEEGDTIHALIKGSAVNNDGNRKGTYQSPCIDGQAEVIQAALHMAEVDPETISYVETHGTGTEIGDPIEIEGLKKAFNTGKKQYCPIGSVKTNFGHLDTAAGAAGLIKTVLALKHRMLPPNLHFNAPNPRIDFENSPFYVNDKLSEWKVNRKEDGSGAHVPRRAGVSSFGIGGTNAHVILEEAPAEIPRKEPYHDMGGDMGDDIGNDRVKPLLIPLSAMTEAALNVYSTSMIEALKEKKGQDLRDAAFTLQTGRKPLSRRKVWVVDPQSPDFSIFNTAQAREKNRVVYMFSGQGAQYVAMGLGLYRSEPVFKESMDHCFQILSQLSPHDFKAILYPDLCSGSSGDGELPDIDQTEITQPMLFIFEYSLALLLQSWGIRPYAMVGHSIGEYVAACLAGVFSLKDAIKIVVRRGKLMQDMPPGDMLSVSLSEEQIAPVLKDFNGLSLAAVNSPSFCVVSGAAEDIATLERQLSADGHQCRILHTSHAFHSGMMEPILEPFEETFGGITLNPPNIPYISNVSGDWITVEEATSPSYWSGHLRGTVRFSDGLTHLFNEENALFVEVGPGRGLSTLVKKHSRRKPSHIVVNLVKHPNEEAPDHQYLLNKAGQLWLYGVDIDWYAFYGENTGPAPYRVQLPPYPFQSRAYRVRSADGRSVGEAMAAGPGTGTGKRPDISQWFYMPSWKRTPAPRQDKAPEPQCWWFFMDEAGIGSSAADLLEEQAEAWDVPITVIRILPGTDYENMGNVLFTIDPEKREDYLTLVKFLKKTGQAPHQVVHMWSVDPMDQAGQKDSTDFALGRGYFSLVYLAQALAVEGIDNKISLTAVTGAAQEVTGDERLEPVKATIYGAAMTIPAEYPNVQTRCIDIPVPAEEDPRFRLLASQLKGELNSPGDEPMVAFRNHYRLVRTYEPSPLPATTSNVEGVVLITGGTGGMGLEFAKHLAKNPGVKLALTARYPLPPEDRWRQWLDAHGPEDGTSRKIIAVREIKKSGTDVLVLAADAADKEAMKKAVTQIETELGPVTGVIHAAGLPGGGIIQIKTPAQTEPVLAPKIQGALVLDELFKDHKLSFMILCSSISSVVPMMGQADYFAANAFMDSFAYSRMSSSNDPSRLTQSINWDTWREVGMGVVAANRLSGVKDVDYPMFDHLLKEDARSREYVTRFTFDGYWVLNQHKITESGKGLAPGVTYIEMARAAFQLLPGQNREKPGTALEISDVYFLNPLMVGAGEDREGRFKLRKQANSQDTFQFEMRSRTSDAGGKWDRHAAGNIRRVTLEPEKQSVTHDLQAIAARCNGKEIVVAKDKVLGEDGLVTFGPRWLNIRRIQTGENEALAYIELDPDYAAETEVYRLHPALLDSAAGFFYPHMGGSTAYIPFSYTRLTIKAPLPAKLYSFCRVSEKSTGRDNGQDNSALKFDVIIMDDRGVELVVVDEFTMLEVSEEIKGRIRGKDALQTGGATVEQSGDEYRLQEEEDNRDKARRFLEHAIRPEEGMEVLDRALGSGTPQLVVSTIHLPTRFNTETRRIDKVIEDKTEAKDLEQGALPRPDISSVYVAPRTDAEQKIAAVWQRVLGVDKVGLNDDFFELGGDSLNIVQLNNELKQIFKKDIPVAVMFRYQNIQAFSKYLQQEETGGTAAVEDRSEEIKKSKDRLKARMRRR